MGHAVKQDLDQVIFGNKKYSTGLCHCEWILQTDKTWLVYKAAYTMIKIFVR